MEAVRDLSLIKALLVEENSIQTLSEKLLGESYVLKVVTSLQEAFGALDNQVFDIVILSLNLPGSKGLDNLNELIIRNSALPVIVLISATQEDLGKRAIQNGAAEFIFESECKSPRLVNRLISYVVEGNEHARIKRDHDRILDLSRKVAKIGSWTWNPQTDVLIPTPTFLKIFDLDEGKDKYSVSEFLNIIHVDDRKEIQKAFEDQVLKRESISIEFRIMSHTNGFKHIFMKGKLAEDSSLAEPVYYGTGQDITELKQTSETLIQKNRFLELTGEVASVGGWEFDLRTEELYWTRASYDIHGRSEDYKPTFKNLEELYPPEYFIAMSDSFYKAISERQSVFLEAPVKIDGTIKWLQYIGKLVFDGDDPIKINGIVYDITTNKQQVKKLEIRAMMLDNIVEAAIAVDVDFNIIFWNRAAEKMYGYSRSETLGKPISAFDLSDVSPEKIEQILAIIKTGENIEDEYVMKHKSGREFPVWSSLSVVMGINNQPEALLYLSRDITEEKEHLKKIEDSEFRFRRLFEYSPVGKGLVDLKTFKWIDANNTLVKLLGYSKKELLKLTPQEITPPEYSDLDLFHLDKLNRLGVFGPFQKEYFKSDGSRLKVIITGFVMNPSIGNKAWVHVLDITELDEKTESLRKSEERFRDYVENATDIILTVDENGHIDYISPNIKKAMDYTESEVTGRHFLDFVHPDDKRKTMNVIAQAMGNSETDMSIINRIRHKNGSYFYVQSEGKFKVSPNGKKHGIVIARNVDQAHRAELHVRKQNEILKDIAYTQSHVLRRPLANILGLIALNNLNEPTPNNTFQLFDLIQKEAAIMDEVVEEIVSKSTQVSKLSNHE